jgi:Ca2+-binding EF-hand superfamily protein
MIPRVTLGLCVFVLASLVGEEPVLADSPGSAAANEALFLRLDADRNGQLTAQEVSSEHRRLFERLLRQGDRDGSKSLSREEFVAGLTPNRPEKRIEGKQPAELPGADAIRWLLLSLDTDGDSTLTRGEAPENLRPAFDALVGQIDRDQNGVLSPQELTQGGRMLSNIAGRIAAQSGVDVSAELAQLEKTQGPAANRFEGRRGRAPERINLERPRQAFPQLDANGDGQLSQAEIPPELQPALGRLFQSADVDRNGQLSEPEFIRGLRQATGQPPQRRGARGPRGRGPRGNSP